MILFPWEWESFNGFLFVTFFLRQVAVHWGLWKITTLPLNEIYSDRVHKHTSMCQLTDNSMLLRMLRAKFNKILRSDLPDFFTYVTSYYSSYRIIKGFMLYIVFPITINGQDSLNNNKKKIYIYMYCHVWFSLYFNVLKRIKLIYFSCLRIVKLNHESVRLKKRIVGKFS